MLYLSPCYLNENDFEKSPETSKQEPEGTEELLNNDEIKVEEAEQENTQREQLQLVRHTERAIKTPIHYRADRYANTANCAFDEAICLC